MTDPGDPGRPRRRRLVVAKSAKGLEAQIARATLAYEQASAASGPLGDDTRRAYEVLNALGNEREAGLRDARATDRLLAEERVREEEQAARKAERAAARAVDRERKKRLAQPDCPPLSPEDRELLIGGNEDALNIAVSGGLPSLGKRW